MVGAAVFLPDHAFAEKKEVSEQQLADKANVLVTKSEETSLINIPSREEKAKPEQKAVFLPKPTLKNNVGLEQVTAKATEKLRNSHKPTAIGKNLTDQAKGNEKSAVKKIEKLAKTLGYEKIDDGKKPKEPGKNPTLKREVGHSVKTSLHHDKTKTNVKKTAPIANKFIKNEPRRKRNLVEVNRVVTPLPEMPEDEDKIPTSKEEFPEASQVMNPPKRANHSGGQSNDRVSSGPSLVSSNDKWFECNRYYEIQFIQSFLHKNARLNNQWVNAPPSPPPQKAPLLNV